MSWRPLTQKFVIPLLVFGNLLGSSIESAEPELIEVRKIWDQATHSAFTDLIRFQGRWLCCFREATTHASKDGTIRIIESADGDT